jgi:hypothetical protein
VIMEVYKLRHTPSIAQMATLLEQHSTLRRSFQEYPIEIPSISKAMVTSNARH